MTATYASIASAVKNYLVSTIDELDSSTASVGDIDIVIDGLLEDSSINTGLVVDFLYSVPHVGDSGRRTNDLWDTYIGCLLILKFDGSDTVEISKEIALNTIWRAFDGGSNKILAGAAGSVATVSIGSAGTGYTATDTLTINGGGRDCTITVDAVGTAGEITDISIDKAGTSYTVKNNYLTIGGTGSGAKIDVDSISNAGTTDRVSVMRVESPEKGTLGEFPYYMIPFTVKVNHGGKA